MCCAVSIHHRLAAKDKRLVEDLYEENVHPLLKVIPVEWEHRIPYGLLHSPKPSKTVKRFLTAAQAAMQ